MAIQHVYVDAHVALHPVAKAFSQRLGVETDVVEDPSALYRSIKETSDPWGSGKQMLWLTRNKGTFLKACPAKEVLPVD